MAGDFKAKKCSFLHSSRIGRRAAGFSLGDVVREARMLARLTREMALRYRPYSGALRTEIALGFRMRDCWVVRNWGHLGAACRAAGAAAKRIR